MGQKLSQERSKVNPLFTLVDISGKFPHLSEAIFNEVDDQSLVKCREVNEPWKTTLGNQKTFWRRYIKKKTKKYDMFHKE